MSDEKRFEGLSDEDLLEELARRRASRLEGELGQAEAEVLRETAEAERRAVEKYLQQRSAQETDAPRKCPRCGSWTPVKDRHREKTLRAVGGDVTFTRHYYYCSLCRKGFCPLDDELGLPESGKTTPEMERRLLDFGVTTPPEEAAQRWSVHYAMPVSSNLIRRVIDRQGQVLVDNAPERVQRAVGARSTQGRQTTYVQVDGSMIDVRRQTLGREIKLGVIFDDCHHLKGGQRRRGLIAQARYVAHLEGLAGFEAELKAALEGEAVQEAPQAAWLGDGAGWIWGLADRLCPDAVQILDWYHALDAAGDCATVLFDLNSRCRELFVERIASLLWEEGPEPVLSELEACLFLATREEERKALKDLAGFYRNQAKRMDYPRYRQMELLIGSGAIEASHRHVLQTRMRRAGQHWSEDGAQKMAKLRALYQTTGPSKFYDTIRRVA